MAQTETNTAHEAPVNVVIVTLDRHLSSSVARTEHALRAQVPGLSISVHAAAEWSSDPDTLAEAKAAIAKADITVACMLFMDDQVQAILPALLARRDDCAVLMGCVSSPEIVKLTKMGRPDMTAEANPKASVRMANRLLEAHDRSYWEADEATLAALQDALTSSRTGLRVSGIAAE